MFIYGILNHQYLSQNLTSYNHPSDISSLTEVLFHHRLYQQFCSYLYLPVLFMQSFLLTLYLFRSSSAFTLSVITFFTLTGRTQLSLKYSLLWNLRSSESQGLNRNCMDIVIFSSSIAVQSALNILFPTHKNMHQIFSQPQVALYVLHILA